MTISTSVPTTGAYDQVQAILQVSIAVSAFYAALDLVPRSQPNGNHQVFVRELLAACQPEQLIGRRSHGNAHNHLWNV